MSGRGQSLFRGFGTAWEEAQADLAASEYAARTAGEGYVAPRPSSGDIPLLQSERNMDFNANLVPMGSSQPAGNQAGFDWQGMTQGLVGGLMNVFRGNTQQYAPPPPVSSGMPGWVWLAIPVGLVGVVLLTRKKSSVAGYRRRKSRR